MPRCGDRQPLTVGMSQATTGGRRRKPPPYPLTQPGATVTPSLEGDDKDCLSYGHSQIVFPCSHFCPVAQSLSS
jgi:hypothetical protein